MTKKGQAFVSRKIRKLVAEGRPHKQAIAIALSMAREKGYTVPKKKTAKKSPKRKHQAKTRTALAGEQVLINPKITSRTRHRYRAVVRRGGRAHSVLIHGANHRTACAYGSHLARGGSEVEISHLSDNGRWTTIGCTR